MAGSFGNEHSIRLLLLDDPPDSTIDLFTVALHEFGHSYVCRHYGGQVTVMGVMLLVFTPLPYMDASSSWGFSRRRQRIHVAAAGMIVELFVAFLAVMVWANTGAGVVQLRNRLIALGFMPRVATASYDGQMQRAVKPRRSFG